MSIRVKMIDALGEVLGASWANPVKVALFGTGAGDYHSPTSFTATQSGPNTITLSGVNPTINNASEFRAVRAYNATGGLLGEWRNSGRYQFSYNATTSILTVANANFGSAASLAVELHAEHRGWSPSEAAWQDYQVNPEHAWTAENQNVAATQGDGTTPYYYDLDMYKFQGFQITDTPGAAGDNTYTIHGSWEDNGTADTAAAYVDMTLAWFNVASVTSGMIAADASAGVLELDEAITCKFIKIQVVRANDGAATDGGWTIDQRRTY